MGVATVEDLMARFQVTVPHLEELKTRTRVRIPAHYASLIEEPGDAIWKQCVPDARELQPDGLPEDPLGETREDLRLHPALICKYPDRALLLVTDRCPMYCRFCFRKSLTHTRSADLSIADALEAVEIVRTMPQIREVILSGGEPLIVPAVQLATLLKKLSEIPQLKWVRVHTKLPCVDPDAVTDELVGVLKTIQPIFVNAHFNHPREVNAKSIAALSRLIDAGIPVGSHTVILAGVNDDDSILEDLFVKLIQARVRPYHIYIADACQGTSHFRTSVARGLEIMDKLRLRCSGMMLPKLMMEGPEGEGKVPVESHVVSTGPELVYRSLHGDLLRYPDGGAGDDRATSRNVPQSRGVVSQKPKGSPLAT